MTDERTLIFNFEKASRDLQTSGGKNGPGAESKYGQAYQALVQVGLKPQIRKKYR